MRNLAIGIAIFLAVVFFGGYVPLGGAPLFERLDSLMGTNFLMRTHYTLFYFLHDSQRAGAKDTTGLRDFQERPLGFDKKQRYHDLDAAGKY